jgi:hypothetical protein
VDEPLERDRRIRELERRFRSAGLPLLAEDYSATEDVFNRAIPLLSVVFVLEILGAINLAWPPALNVLALLGGVALVLVAFGLLNVSRGRRFFSVPQKLGVPELTAFVVLPVVLPLVFGGQLTSALVTGLGNLVLLGLIWLVVGFGVFSILRWTAARFVQLLGASLTLLVRALPLLLFFSLVTFFTNEYWQLFGQASDVTFYAAAGLFALITAVFLIVRLPGSVRDLERGSSLAVPLDRRQRVNVGLVIFLAQALQIAFVGVAICSSSWCSARCWSRRRSGRTGSAARVASCSPCRSSASSSRSPSSSSARPPGSRRSRRCTTPWPRPSTPRTGTSSSSG